MLNNILDFEKPLIELAEKIKELQSFMDEKGIDLSEEINRLEERAINLQKEIYAGLNTRQILQIARHQNRPTADDYVKYVFDEFVELHGDRRYGDDQAMLGGIALIDGIPITLIGHNKGKSTKENLKRNFGMPNPEGYRKALRLMKQAEKFNRPIISLINTPGAFPGIGAEERGQAEAIAVNLMEMAELEVPIIVIVTGEGGSGGALGIGMGDKVMMLQYSYYSVSTPESCATILWKDAKKAGEAAESLQITADKLLQRGLIDEIIKEPAGGAHKDHEEAALLVKKAILTSINELKGLSTDELLTRRFNKYRKIGKYTMEDTLNDTGDLLKEEVE